MLRIALILFIFLSLLLNWVPVHWQVLGDFNTIAIICCVLILIFCRRPFHCYVLAALSLFIIGVSIPIANQASLLNSISKTHRDLTCQMHIQSRPVAALFQSSQLIAELQVCHAPPQSEAEFVFHDASISGALVEVYIDESQIEKVPLNAIVTADLKMKPIRQKANGQSFDYEKHAFSQGLIWTARVNGNVQVISKQIDSFIQFKLGIADWFQTFIKSIPVAEEGRGLFLAFTIGDKSELNSEFKQLVSNLGLMHLLVISGLHLGLIAGYAMAIAYVITWIFPRLNMLMPRLDLQLSLGFIFATFYWLVLPDSEPVYRAWLTYVIWCVVHFLRINISLFDKFLLSCSGVLLIDPFAALSLGFHLTMSALGSICMIQWFNERYVEKTWIKLVNFQLAMSILMMPFLLMNGMSISIASPLINLIITPIFSLIVMPLVFLLSSVTILLEPFASLSINWLMNFIVTVFGVLEPLAQPKLMLDPVDFPIFLIAASWSIFVMWMVRSRVKFCTNINTSETGVSKSQYGKSIQTIGMVCIIVFTHCYAVFSLKPDSDIELIFHDVGQGSAVSWHNQQQVSFFDTGPQWQGHSIMQSHILPKYLSVSGDHLFVSHNDNDHAGAIKALLDRFQFRQVISGEQLVSVAHQFCQAGQMYEGDFWQVEILYPLALGETGNAASCTALLKLGYADQQTLTVLLNGDISTKHEKRILERLKSLGSIDVLMLAHHGSKFSTSRELLQMTKPKFVIATAGFWNAYGHPAKEVLARVGKSIEAGIRNTSSGNTSSGNRNSEDRDKQNRLPISLPRVLTSAKDGAVIFRYSDGMWRFTTERERLYVWQYVESF